MRPGVQFFKNDEIPMRGVDFMNPGIYHVWPTKKEARPNKNKFSPSYSKKISPIESQGPKSPTKRNELQLKKTYLEH